jgi:hypothetical protein
LNRIAAWFSGSALRDEIADADQGGEILTSTNQKSQDNGLILERESAEWPGKCAMPLIVLAVWSIFRTSGAAVIVFERFTNTSCSRE